MKKSWFVITIVVVASFLLSACNGEVIKDPSISGSSAVETSEINVWDSANLKGLKPIRDVAIEEYGLVAKAFVDPGSIQSALMVIPAAAVTGVSDGPQVGPADIVAAFMVAGALYFVCVHSAKFIGQAIADITANDYRSMWTSSAASNKAASIWTATLATTITENAYLSTRHYESPFVIAGAYAYAEKGKLRKQGDGNSSGSIRMYAGIQPGMKANIAILMVVGTQVNFMIIQGDLMTAAHSVIPSGAIDLGSGNYLMTKAAKIICAWTLSKDIGHGKKDPSEFLTVGQGWQYWATMQAKYNLYTEVVEIQLP